MRGISGNFQAGYGATLKSTGVPLDTKWHIVDQNKNICSMDGVDVAEFEYANFTAPKSIALGGINANNKLYYGEGRYSDTQVYDNGVLVRDVIPCEDPDGNIGMYDTVNAKFRGNAGTAVVVHACYLNRPQEAEPPRKGESSRSLVDPRYHRFYFGSYVR
jgi:hypothetical protein